MTPPAQVASVATRAVPGRSKAAQRRIGLPLRVAGATRPLHFNTEPRVSIRQLFYVSRPARPISPVELRQIIGVATMSNRRAGITGLLVYTGGHFAQLVEGPPTVVGGLVDRIGRDPRHVGVRILVDRHPVDHRDFSQWDMQLVESPDLDATLEALMTTPDDATRCAEALARITAAARWHAADDVGRPPPLA